MTFRKADVPQEMDDYKRLMCSYPNCQNRWTVSIESPKCSFHQWGNVKELTEKKVKQETPRFEQPADIEAWWQK